MAGGGGGIEKGEPDFQIAPMVDVLLVMLIFFMVITSAQVSGCFRWRRLRIAGFCVARAAIGVSTSEGAITLIRMPFLA